MNQITITKRAPGETGYNFRLSFSGKQINFLFTRYLLPLIAEEIKTGIQTTDHSGKHSWACNLSTEKQLKVAEILRQAMEKNEQPYAYQNSVGEPRHMA